jgi:hypothetical protein
VLRLHSRHSGERAPEAQRPDVAGEHAGHHGVDQDGGGLRADPAGGEIVDALVGALGPAPGERLGEDAEATAEAEDRAPEEARRPARQEVEPAVPEEVAAGGALVGRLEAVLDPEPPDQLERGGHVVQEPVGPLLDGEPVDAVRPDVPAGLGTRLEYDDLHPLPRAIPEVERRGEAGDPAADDDDARHRRQTVREKTGWSFAFSFSSK